jgi:hypothetical protein
MKLIELGKADSVTLSFYLFLRNGTTIEEDHQERDRR